MDFPYVITKDFSTISGKIQIIPETDKKEFGTYVKFFVNMEEFKIPKKDFDMLNIHDGKTIQIVYLKNSKHIIKID
jgi:hypothetical protein